MITVVGLGCNAKQITLEGAEKIAAARRVVVKTALSDTYPFFTQRGMTVETLDRFYESAEDFDELDRKIAEYLIDAARESGALVYCVDGSGKDDRSVIALIDAGAQIEIVPSVSRAECNAAPNAAMTRIGAYELDALTGFDYDTRGALCVCDIDNALIASQVKLILGNLIGEEETVFVNGREMPLYELDRLSAYDYRTALYVPPLELTKKKRFNFVDLYCVMRALRGENGCPWDRAQTHESIRANALEEAYELVDAINNDDLDNMIEESGDVLLQSVFHCVIGEDCGEYNVQDALTALCRKLIDRHTHIFGDVKANNADEALAAWDAAKAKEKKYASASDKMKKVAQSLPALERAYKYGAAAAKIGLDFDDFGQIADKIAEELKEYAQAQDAAEREDEGGDLLFAAVNALRWFKVDPEIALARAADKFMRRVQWLEQTYGDPSKWLKADGWDERWEEAKRATRQD